MSTIGKVDGLWRYPVKSMRGEGLAEAYVSFSGIYGDRIYAFKSTACAKVFPYLTGREQARLLLFEPRFRKPDLAAKPVNWAEAAHEAPGLNACFDDPDNLAVDVETPSGEVLAIDDPALIAALRHGLDDAHEVSLLRSDRALTDCRPVSPIATQTVDQLGDEISAALEATVEARVAMRLAEERAVLSQQSVTNAPEADEPTVSSATTDTAAAPPVSGESAPFYGEASVALHLRKGPGQNYASQELIPTGMRLRLLGRTVDSGWYFVSITDGSPADETGWVAAWLVTIPENGDPLRLAVVSPLPPSTQNE